MLNLDYIDVNEHLADTTAKLVMVENVTKAGRQRVSCGIPPKCILITRLPSKRSMPHALRLVRLVSTQ